MKKLLLSSLLLGGILASQNVRGQDVAINILSVPPSIAVGQTGKVLVSVCNASSDLTSPPNRLRPQLSLPPTRVQITGVTNIDGTPISNYSIVLQNTGTIVVEYAGTLAPNTCSEFYVTIVGIAVSDLEPISATLGFNGPQTEENDPSNDNSTTAVTITAAAMPVDLVSFQGKWVKDQGNELSWVTSWEKNNDHFEVQSSTNAKSFESVGRVAGSGNTAAQKVYTYMDTNPLADLTYYRLKQVNTDATLTYSKVVAIRRGFVDKSLVIYPNPATDQLGLKVSDQTISEANLYDLSGQRVLHQMDGATQVQLGSVKAGVYVVEVKTTAGTVYRQRFIKR